MDAAWMGGTAIVAFGVALLAAGLLVVTASLGVGYRDAGRWTAERRAGHVAMFLAAVAILGLLVSIGLALLLAFGGAVGLVAAVWPW